jgi:hypothetical protein
MAERSQKLSASQLHEKAIVVDGHVHIIAVFSRGIDP